MVSWRYPDTTKRVRVAFVCPTGSDPALSVVGTFCPITPDVMITQCSAAYFLAWVRRNFTSGITKEPMRIVTAGHAVKAMGLNGLGFLNQPLSLGPHFFQNKPLSRLIAPGMQASHLNDDTLGRALDTLYETGLPELYTRIAAPAARPLGLP